MYRVAIDNDGDLRNDIAFNFVHAQSERVLVLTLAREVLAKIQAERKRLDLGYTERIALSIEGSERICRVVEGAREHLSAEALCDRLTTSEQPEDKAQAHLGEEWLSVSIERV